MEDKEARRPGASSPELLASEQAPTPHPKVNALLRELFKSVKGVLGSHFVGMYLDGSLASGDFDQESDIDFVVVSEHPITDNLFAALAAMHERIAAIDSH